MAGRIKEHEIAAGIRLPLCSSCAEGECTIFCLLKVADIKVDVGLLGQGPARPSWRPVILNLVSVQEQIAELHDGKTL